MLLCFVDYRGSAIARIVGANVKGSELFDDEVKMWVFEEMVDGRKLTEIINEEHENTKYLPGFKIPPNVVSGALQKNVFVYLWIESFYNKYMYL